MIKRVQIKMMKVQMIRNQETVLTKRRKIRKRKLLLRKSQQRKMMMIKPTKVKSKSNQMLFKYK